MRLPDVKLPDTAGGTQNMSTLPGRTVLVIYPYTGKPGVPDPPGWDDIPGAHGSTAQLLAYSRSYDDFLNVGVKLFGIGPQHMDWQREFVSRIGLRFPLLSDAERHFANSVNLETFVAGSKTYFRRRTLVTAASTIIHDRRNVAVPEADASDVLRWLKAATP